MRILLWVLSLAAVGCGSGGIRGAPDAAPDSGTDPQPDASSARCDVTKPFNAPTLMAGVNGPGRDIQASLADELTLYMTSDRRLVGGVPNMDLYTATRSSPREAWSTPALLAGFSTNDSERSAYLTADGLTMTYAAAPYGQDMHDVYIATRSSTRVGFSPPTPLTVVNTSYDDVDTVLTGDGTLLYFDSTRPGTGAPDIYVSARSAGGDFGPPRPVDELNSTSYESHPRVTSDGLTIYFSSMRPPAAPPNTDIWMATRPSRNAPFGAPTRVAELSTDSPESVTWVSPDGCHVILQSNRPGGPGGQDLWEAVKPL